MYTTKHPLPSYFIHPKLFLLNELQAICVEIFFFSPCYLQKRSLILAGSAFGKMSKTNILQEEKRGYRALSTSQNLECTQSGILVKNIKNTKCISWGKRVFRPGIPQGKNSFFSRKCYLLSPRFCPRAKKYSLGLLSK